MLNQLHPLYQLADKIDWESICIHASDNDSLKHEKEAQRIFPVGSLQINIFAYLCIMKPDQLLRAILPDVLIDNFDIVSFDKSADRFDIYLDEKKVQLKEDKYNPEIIAYGFGDYRVIQDYPIRGRATYLHVRKRKWLDKSSNEIFSYDWDLSEFDGTRLNSEFVSFLKEGD